MLKRELYPRGVVSATPTQRTTAPGKLVVIGGPSVVQITLRCRGVRDLRLLSHYRFWYQLWKRTGGATVTPWQETKFSKPLNKSWLELQRNHFEGGAEDPRDIELRPVILDLAGRWRCMYQVFIDWKVDYLLASSVVAAQYSADEIQTWMTPDCSEEELRAVTERVLRTGENRDDLIRRAKAQRIAQYAFRAFMVNSVIDIEREIEIPAEVASAYSVLGKIEMKRKAKATQGFTISADEFLPIRQEVYSPYYILRELKDDLDITATGQKKKKRAEVPRRFPFSDEERSRAYACGYFFDRDDLSFFGGNQSVMKKFVTNFQIDNSSVFVFDRVIPFEVEPLGYASEDVFFIRPNIEITFTFESRCKSLGVFNRFAAIVPTPVGFATWQREEDVAVFEDETLRLYYYQDGELLKPFNDEELVDLVQSDWYRVRAWGRWLTRRGGSFTFAGIRLPPHKIGTALSSYSIRISKDRVESQWEVNTGRSAERIPRDLRQREERMILEAVRESAIEFGVPFGNPVRASTDSLIERSVTSLGALTKHRSEVHENDPLDSRLLYLNCHHTGPVVMYDPNEIEDVSFATVTQIQTAPHLHRDSNRGPLLNRPPPNGPVKGKVVVAGHIWWQDGTASWSIATKPSHAAGGFYYPWVAIPSSIFEGPNRGIYLRSSATYPDVVSSNGQPALEFPKSESKGLRLQFNVREPPSTDDEFNIPDLKAALLFEYTTPDAVTSDATAVFSFAVNRVKAGEGVGSGYGTTYKYMKLPIAAGNAYLYRTCVLVEIPSSYLVSDSTLWVDVAREVTETDDTYSGTVHVLGIKFVYTDTIEAEEAAIGG